ncbi:DUF2593 family protein [Erwinia tracheiphila]|uniref:DUF2593 family protein n=1 Tax=Erwinia tracheiphila TaxID=65700 RepID=A0A345CS25_9GAMM|nr:DUF2593 family protein [Erwinia tracheiphila]
MLIQSVVVLYLYSASMGWVYPELFNISGNSLGPLIPRLISVKLPDLAILFLFFVPETGRDADLLIMMKSKIPTDDLIVHFL